MALDPALVKCMKSGKSMAECRKASPPKAVPKPKKAAKKKSY